MITLSGFHCALHLKKCSENYLYNKRVSAFFTRVSSLFSNKKNFYLFLSKFVSTFELFYHIYLNVHEGDSSTKKIFKMSQTNEVGDITGGKTFFSIEKSLLMWPIIPVPKFIIGWFKKQNKVESLVCIQ